MLRRSFLRLVAAGSVCSAGSYFPVTSKAQAAIPGTVTWGGAYLLDDQTNDMPNTKTALSLNSSSSPTGQSVNSAILEAIRNSDWPAAGIDLRTGLKRKITRYGMSFGLARESVLQNGYRPHRDKTVFSLRLIGYNTIFDFQERRIISAFAVRGRYFHTLKGRVGEDSLPRLFFDLLANRDNRGSIARFMTDLALDYDYEIKYRGKNFRFTETLVSPFAAKAADLIDLDLGKHDRNLGYIVSTAFSEKLKAPVVPYLKTSIIRNVTREMVVATTSGDSLLNTSLPFSDAEIEIRVIDHGWEFKESEDQLEKTGTLGTGKITKQDLYRLDVALGARLELKFVDVETDQILYEQQFWGVWRYKEYAEHEFQMARKSRVYMLHETIIDRAIESIINEDLRGRLYDGLDIKFKDDTGTLIETYYLEALADDWDVLSAECAQIIKQLPKAFGT